MLSEALGVLVFLCPVMSSSQAQHSLGMDTDRPVLLLSLLPAESLHLTSRIQTHVAFVLLRYSRCSNFLLCFFLFFSSLSFSLGW